MNFELKNLQITTWYKAVIAISTAVLLLAIYVNNLDIATIAAGTLTIGIAEWINHPKAIEIRGPYKITSFNRTPSLLGWLLDAIGVALMLYGTYRLLR